MCSQELFRGGRFRKTARRIVGLLRVKISSAPQMVPRRDILRRANPHVEVGADPARRKYSVIARNFSSRGCCFRGGPCTDVRIVFNSSAKLPQEFAPVAAEI